MNCDRDTYTLRRTAEQLVSEADDCLTFDGVEFVSRAFAEETIGQAHEQEVEIDVRPADEAVAKMFDIVATSREDHGYPSREFLTVPDLDYDFDTSK